MIKFMKSFCLSLKFKILKDHFVLPNFKKAKFHYKHCINSFKKKKKILMSKKFNFKN